MCGGLTIVNGYLCFTSCQAATARAGKNPYAPPGQTDQKHKANGLLGQPPGSLDPSSASNGVNNTNGINGTNDPNAVDPTGTSGAVNSDYSASQSVNLLI